jgi:pyruvate/2-oxoglutarate dehydrogenase complex dihydrolipoamide dehydrogenase (E3) component
MSEPEQFEVLILGSGEAGKLLAWHVAGLGRRIAVVEQRWIGLVRINEWPGREVRVG